MPAGDSPAIIVARFLKANNYDDTLDAFLKEAGLPLDSGTLSKGDLTIENILEEKKVFDVSVRFEKLGFDGGNDAWSLPAPSSPTRITTLPCSTNLLHVSIEDLGLTDSQEISQVLIATTADRRLNRLDLDLSFALKKSHAFLHDAPILSCITLSRDPPLTITTGMSGQVILYDHHHDSTMDERRDHKKYVIKVSTFEDEDGAWIATAGWDAKVFVYRTTRDSNGHFANIGAPLASISLPTNPETVLFVNHPSTNQPLLLVSRRDSTFLHYYMLPPYDSQQQSASSPTPPVNLSVFSKQNLAPHSNAWIAFSPSSIAICPTDPTLLAIATSAQPHMKLIFVRMLFPSGPSTSVSTPPTTTTNTTTTEEPFTTQASQTLSHLARANEEEAAILIHATTMAPQTAYSTPQVAWRPDGSGVWVNSDDGIIRGVERKTGKVVAQLKGGHEAGSKVRSIWAGWVWRERNGGAANGGEDRERGREREEWVVSGGFDRRLIVWRVGGAEGKEEEKGLGERDAD